MLEGRVGFGKARINRSLTIELELRQQKSQRDNNTGQLPSSGGGIYYYILSVAV
jgi:hypothetical protein